MSDQSAIYEAVRASIDTALSGTEYYLQSGLVSCRNGDFIFNIYRKGDELIRKAKDTYGENPNMQFSNHVLHLVLAPSLGILNFSIADQLPHKHRHHCLSLADPNYPTQLLAHVERQYHYLLSY